MKKTKNLTKAIKLAIILLQINKLKTNKTN